MFLFTCPPSKTSDESAASWAGRKRFVCRRCGALNLFGQSGAPLRCAYCASKALVEEREGRQSPYPRWIVPFKVDAKEAIERVRQWMQRSFLVPEVVRSNVSKIRFHPAYYPFFAFDGLLEVHWHCLVRVGFGTAGHWVPRSGTYHKFFKELLVPGIEALILEEVEAIEPFDLDESVEFAPKLLGGKVALGFTRTLKEASQLGFKKLMGRFRGEWWVRIEPTHEKRRLELGGGNWVDVTFTHILLPIWVGNFQYKKKSYRLLVNGQSGKVSGSLPADYRRLYGFWLLTLLFFIGMMVVVSWFLLH